jgi:hypothetical protein
MKKIYLMLMLLMVGVAANAQRNITIAVLVVKPAIDTNVTTTSTQNPVYYFQNISATTADSLQVGDTIKYYTPGSTFSGSSYTSYEYVICPFTLKKDSIIAVNGLATPFAKIESLYNSTKTFVAKPFTNNTQYWWYLRPAGVGGKAGGIPIASFTPGTTDTQRIWINKTSSINESFAASNETIKTFPNPAVNQLSFEYNFTSNENATAKIMDVAGRTVFVKEFENNSGNQKFDLDINSLNTGTYMLHFIVGEKTMTNKFNVQK